MENILTIKQAFVKPLPGGKAQYLMAPQGRNLVMPPNKPTQKAAVLILLFPLNNLLHTVFIKRPPEKGPHSKQISLPGGKFETSDGSLLNTALRETYEEIGIASKQVEILGALTPLFIPVSGFEVFPFVGYSNNGLQFKTQPNEVESLIIVSIQNLQQRQIVKSETWQLHGKNAKVPFYEVEQNKIWGATAMILSEFLQLIE